MLAVIPQPKPTRHPLDVDQTAESCKFLLCIPPFRIQCRAYWIRDANPLESNKTPD